MQRGARARSTKQKGRIQRFEALRDKKGPVEDGKVEMESISSRLGRTTIEISDLCKSYGDKVLVKDYTYFFLKDDRIGYIGPNGSGKSTADEDDRRLGQTGFRNDRDRTDRKAWIFFSGK